MSKPSSGIGRPYYGRDLPGHAVNTSLYARLRPSMAADGPGKGYPSLVRQKQSSHEIRNLSTLLPAPGRFTTMDFEIDLD